MIRHQRFLVGEAGAPTWQKYICPCYAREPLRRDLVAKLVLLSKKCPVYLKTPDRAIRCHILKFAFEQEAKTPGIRVLDF
jgi:hypothetical protein